MNTKIYVLTEPNGEIRYVGKTSMSLLKRLGAHLSKARKYARNGHLGDWLRSILSTGHLPVISLIGEVEGNGNKEEIAWIAYGKNEGWRLVNTTEGGEGSTGYRHTEEARKRIGIFHRGNTYARGHSAWNKGRKCSKEECLKMSNARKGSHHSDEANKKQSERMKGHKVSAETRAKLSVATKRQIATKGHPALGHHCSDEAKAKIGAAHRKT